MRLPSTVADASKVIVHIGVGTPSPPEGKVSRIVSVDPETDPEIVPAFNLWHEAHEPSAALSGARSALPDTAVPFCVSDQDMRSAPCGSVPVPLHAPVSPAFGGAGAVDGGAGVGDEGIVVGELHAATDASAAATAPRISPRIKLGISGRV